LYKDIFGAHFMVSVNTVNLLLCGKSKHFVYFFFWY